LGPIFVCLLINHRGPSRNAIFIPKPQWTGLDKLQKKAFDVHATEKDIQGFSNGTCMYDLLFQCWASDIKTVFVCNNRTLGDFIENNYLRRSFTWLSLMWAGFCNDVATVITDFCCTKGQDGLRLLKYAWIRRGDGRSGSCFKSLDWWAGLDHLQYTLKICQGLDYNPPRPHFGVGFCYTSPNTACVRRVLQQLSRVRKFKKNSLCDTPTIYIALGKRVLVKHLPVCGTKH